MCDDKGDNCLKCEDSTASIENGICLCESKYNFDKAGFCNYCFDHGCDYCE